jgi:uncharacterized protein (DUF2249 family)
MSLTDTSATIDVRAIPPRERHSLIFGTLRTLPVNDALELVNDHDPRPLYHQLQAEMPGRFSWNYLECGPGVWRVRIGKLRALADADAGTCCGGCCGG